jgi:hypothetical protein
MKRPCGGCDKLDKCRICYLYTYSSKYNLVWGGNGIVLSPPGGRLLNSVEFDTLCRTGELPSIPSTVVKPTLRKTQFVNPCNCKRKSVEDKK